MANAYQSVKMVEQAKTVKSAHSGSGPQMRGYNHCYRESDESQDTVLRAFYSNFPTGYGSRMANAYLSVKMVE